MGEFSMHGRGCGAAQVAKKGTCNATASADALLVRKRSDCRALARSCRLSCEEVPHLPAAASVPNPPNVSTERSLHPEALLLQAGRSAAAANRASWRFAFARDEQVAVFVLYVAHDHGGRVESRR